MKPEYYCKECGGAVAVAPSGVVTRTCPHQLATIVAERSSVLFGEGGAGEMSLLQRAAQALQKIAGAVRHAVR